MGSRNTKSGSQEVAPGAATVSAAAQGSGHPMTEDAAAVSITGVPTLEALDISGAQYEREHLPVEGSVNDWLRAYYRCSCVCSPAAGWVSTATAAVRSTFLPKAGLPND